MRFGESFKVSQDLFKQIAKHPNLGKVICVLLRTETVSAFDVGIVKSMQEVLLSSCPSGLVSCHSTGLGLDIFAPLCVTRVLDLLEIAQTGRTRRKGKKP